MKKSIAAFVLLGLLTLTAVGIAGPERTKTPSSPGEVGELTIQPREAPDSIRLSNGPSVKRLPNNVNCRTLKCLNKALTKLNRAANALLFTTFTCEQLMAISQYFGYRYDDGVTEFSTTALDNTVPGETPGALAVVDTCG